MLHKHSIISCVLHIDLYHPFETFYRTCRVPLEDVSLTQPRGIKYQRLSMDVSQNSGAEV